MDRSEKDLQEIIAKKFIPAIIADLLSNNQISKYSSKSEVNKEIVNYIHDTERWNSINIAITIGDEFEDAIENEIFLGRNNVAVALAGICIEQVLNEFYQQMLLSKCKFSISEYNSCMKSVSVRDKLTWLYKKVTNESVDNEIVAKVTKICSERNKIVHYRPRIETMKEWGEPIKEDIQKLNIDELLPLIRKIKDIFESELSFQFEDVNVAQEIYNKYFNE